MLCAACCSPRAACCVLCGDTCCVLRAVSCVLGGLCRVLRALNCGYVLRAVWCVQRSVCCVLGVGDFRCTVTVGFYGTFHSDRTVTVTVTVTVTAGFYGTIHSDRSASKVNFEQLFVFVTVTGACPIKTNSHCNSHCDGHCTVTVESPIKTNSHCDQTRQYCAGCCVATRAVCCSLFALSRVLCAVCGVLCPQSLQHPLRPPESTDREQDTDTFSRSRGGCRFCSF